MLKVFYRTKKFCGIEKPFLRVHFSKWFCTRDLWCHYKESDMLVLFLRCHKFVFPSFLIKFKMSLRRKDTILHTYTLDTIGPYSYCLCRKETGSFIVRLEFWWPTVLLFFSLDERKLFLGLRVGLWVFGRLYEILGENMHLIPVRDEGEQSRAACICFGEEYAIFSSVSWHLD